MRAIARLHVGLLLAMALVLAACGGGQSGGEATGGGQSSRLNIAGSSALLPLVQEAANQYQQANPNVQIAVSAGGSGAGRTQVCRGAIDIGMSDVALTDSEREELSCQNAAEAAVAIQAFGPVANPTGPGSVTNLTKEQLQGIFNGTITNWSEVGGDDQRVVVINRAEGSGTRAKMAEYLFDGDDTQFTTGASAEANSETVLTNVRQTPGTISYLGFAFLADPNVLALSVDGVLPTEEDIQNGSWPIQGSGYAITREAPSGLALDFLNFMTSNEFQDNPALQTLGFVPIAPDLRSN